MHSKRLAIKANTRTVIQYTVIKFCKCTSLSYVHAYTLSLSKWSYFSVLTCLVMMRDDKLPTWCDEKRWMIKTWNVGLGYSPPPPFFGCPWHMEFLGQKSDLSHSCNPSLSHDDAASLTHSAGPGMEPVSQHSQDTTNPIVQQRELQG